MDKGKRYAPNEKKEKRREDLADKEDDRYVDEYRKKAEVRYEKRRARRQKKNPQRTSAPTWIYRTAGVLLAGVLVLLIVFGIRSCSTEKVGEWFENATVGSRVGDGFPVSIVGNVVNAKNFLCDNREITMVSDTALVRMNNTAKTLINRQHSYGRPVLSVAGDHMLVYNLGSAGYSIEKKEKTKRKEEMENDASIMAADIAPNGRYAIVTNAKEYLSQLQVFLENDSVQYKYSFSEYYVTGIALNQDGTKAAVSALSAKEGAIQSAIYLFDFSKEEPVAVLTYPENMMLSLEYFSDGSVIAVGDQMVSVIDANSGQKADYSYESRKLSDYSLYNGQVALALEPYDTSSTSKLVVLGAKAEVVAELDITEKMSSISLRGDTVAVLCGQTLYGYSVNALKNRNSAESASGNPLQTLDAGRDAKAIALSDESSIYILGVSEIRYLHFS